MHRIGPRTLQQRLVLFLLLPVAVLLLGVGLGGFFYARRALVAQWGEAALLKLQRAAHNVDMRLNRPKQWVDMIGTVPHPNGDVLQKFVVEKLRTMDGVVEVHLEWNQAGAENGEEYRDQQLSQANDDARTRYAVAPTHPRPSRLHRRASARMAPEKPFP